MSEVVPLLRHQHALMDRFPVVSFDTEFPGFFRNTSIDATDLTRYEDLKHNVDPLRLIQVVITVADASVVVKHRNLCWVTFHGLYDLSHTLRTVTNRPLPHSVAGFTSLLGIVFGDVVDIKYTACFFQGLRGGEVSLAAITKILNVERVGGAHHARSDSLLMARVYTKMRMVYKIHDSLCGLLVWCLS
ncbi:hypothetical protein POTOM_055851 [Populus tomentosa]|uniref:Uncharacterized protein n=1 Tax=Populus tomentosa TaxID=118781 RepID=A0A8X7Y0W3_POPTO|nr:hypothetical protein POTOM_055851 [Populus tomentosa]